MGGVTSLIAAGEGYVNASAVILVDIAAKLELAGIERIRAFMSQKPDGFGSLDEVAAAISLYQPHRPRPENLAGIRKNVRLSPEGRYRWHWDPQYLASQFDETLLEERLTNCARKLSSPTLLIRGGLSDVLSEQGAEEFLEQCPHCEYVNVTGAAHMIVSDRNDAFAQSMIEFLSRTVPAGPSQTLPVQSMAHDA